MTESKEGGQIGRGEYSTVYIKKRNDSLVLAQKCIKRSDKLRFIDYKVEANAFAMSDQILSRSGLQLLPRLYAWECDDLKEEETASVTKSTTPRSREAVNVSPRMCTFDMEVFQMTAQEWLVTHEPSDHDIAHFLFQTVLRMVVLGQRDVRNNDLFLRNIMIRKHSFEPGSMMTKKTDQREDTKEDTVRRGTGPVVKQKAATITEYVFQDTTFNATLHNSDISNTDRLGHDANNNSQKERVNAGAQSITLVDPDFDCVLIDFGLASGKDHLGLSHDQRQKQFALKRKTSLMSTHPLENRTLRKRLDRIDYYCLYISLCGVIKKVPGMQSRDGLRSWCCCLDEQLESAPNVKSLALHLIYHPFIYQCHLSNVIPNRVLRVGDI